MERSKMALRIPGLVVQPNANKPSRSATNTQYHDSWNNGGQGDSSYTPTYHDSWNNGGAGDSSSASRTPAPRVNYTPHSVRASKGGTYKVKVGDTLSAIAAANGTTVAALAATNGISNPNVIGVGQTLKMPTSVGQDSWDHRGPRAPIKKAPAKRAPVTGSPSVPSPQPAPKMATTQSTAPAAIQSVAPVPNATVAAPQYKEVPIYETEPVYEQQPVYETLEIPDAKADPDYQKQVSDLARALANYQDSQQLAEDQYNQNYNERLHDMGYVPGSGFSQTGPGAYAQDFGSNEGDFAGRGAYYSGAYARAVDNLNNAYQQQYNQLDTAKNQYTDSMDLANQQYSAQNTLDQQQALTQAIARIAAQYGVDTNQIPVGTGSPNEIKRQTGTKQVQTGTKQVQTGTKKVQI